MTNKKLEDIFMSYLEKIPEDLKLGGVNVLKVFTSLSTDKKQLTTKDSEVEK